jgi:tRNA threonylcarbamoyladenosine modification (KEOPS) complex  Pcc1 subunit
MKLKKNHTKKSKIKIIIKRMRVKIEIKNNLRATINFLLEN